MSDIGFMFSISGLINVFGNEAWQTRANSHPRRIYAFVLASDEHRDVLEFVRSAWRSLDVLSGDSCDIFTFEQPDHCAPRLITAKGLVEFTLPSRQLCYDVRDQLFETPESVVLPGIALFASSVTKDALFVRCAGLNPQQMSDLFQEVLSGIREISRISNGDRFDVFESFVQQHRRKQVKSRVFKTVSNITIKDVFSILSKL
jgi:hypothetical protein